MADIHKNIKLFVVALFTNKCEAGVGVVGSEDFYAIYLRHPKGHAAEGGRMRDGKANLKNRNQELSLYGSAFHLPVCI